MLEDAPTEKRMLPSDVKQDLPPRSRQRLQLEQKYEPPPETEVEVSFCLLQGHINFLYKELPRAPRIQSLFYNSFWSPALEVSLKFLIFIAQPISLTGGLSTLISYKKDGHASS